MRYVISHRYPLHPMKGLRVMYAANVLVSGPIGVAYVFAPSAMRALMEMPPGDPFIYGIAAGALPLGFGIAGGIGFLNPVGLSPVLLVQAIYKSCWLLGVVLPLAWTGTVPAHAIPLIVIFLFFVAGNLLVLPYGALFERAR